jgi:uncharacterized PurR-regulated membrane protein YhhQ (DUF165 family)
LGTAVYPLVGEAPVWAGWAFADLLVKLAVALVLLIPFRALINVLGGVEAQRRTDQPPS